MGKKIKVGLIYGGKSGEHSVSVLSAVSMMKAIDSDKYDVIPIGITREGQWLFNCDPNLIVESGQLDVTATADVDQTGILENREGWILSGLRQNSNIDIIFPVLHGPFGEDGTIQGLLEMADLPYVGCGVLASSVGMDKGLMKSVFQQVGLPVGPYLVYKRRDLADFSAIATAVAEKLKFPCFVKPANLGSSVGISKAHNEAELREALNLAAKYDRRIVIEAMLYGHEIECGVLGNDQPQASLVGEIVTGAEFYDYEDKYIKNESHTEIPAKIPQNLAEQVRKYAVQAFTAIDGAGLSRVDFFVNDETGEIFINEINTLPGFTSISMYAKMWEASGLSYTELISRLIELAFERYNEKKSL